MKYSLSLILLFCVAISFGQEKVEQRPLKRIDPTNNTDHSPEGDLSIDNDFDYSQIFTSVQVQAIPPGGMNAFRKSVAASFKLPQVTEKTIGTVVAKFVVWDDGTIKNIQIIKETPTNLGLGNEATRVLSSSDKWIPGKYNGRNVKQYYTLPISIQITPTEKIIQPIEEFKKEQAPVLSEKVIEASVSTPEKKAEPIGGVKKLYADLASKIQIPEVEVAGNYKTRVKFLVNQDGSLSDFQVVTETPSNVGLGLNVIKYLQGYGNWTPGEQNGRKVKTYFVLPVTLNIEPDIEPEIKKKE
jgi:hypothetical protein